MSDPTRRDVLAGALAGAALVACQPVRSGRATDPVLGVQPLGAPPWPTTDPFLFCVHHDDRYPAGNDHLGPDAPLTGRDLGQDFAGLDGWRMYHGGEVPGFPSHPHRGFETVTLARRGFIDHADSLGATARYGAGDAQWLTAGAGIVHAEMFPLVERQAPNPLELFQIWLNLPRTDKLTTPHFSMLWREGIKTHTEGGASITVVAGSLGDVHAPPPPPHSWAARGDTGVVIWTITLAPGARWTVPPAARGSDRSLYFFEGTELAIGGRAIPPGSMVRLRGDAAAPLSNGATPAQVLLLGGRPIGEPVAKRGPFVMNTGEEIEQAFADYRRTRFGGWPWKSAEPVHPRASGRFAVHADGRKETAG
jgi:quercetin 2,3-dioxygenase